jgi:hypothetical protein
VRLFPHFRAEEKCRIGVEADTPVGKDVEDILGG